MKMTMSLKMTMGALLIAATIGFARRAVTQDAKPGAQAAPAKADAAPAPTQVRQGPRRLIPGEHGIGRYVADVEFRDVADRPQSLKRLAADRLLVVAMTSTSCPISKKYLPSLVDLAKTYGDRKVRFLLVNPVGSDEPNEMRAAQAKFGDTAVYAFDPQGVIARAVGAESTADVVVLDGSRTVVYHGAIDDQYGLGYSLDEPRHHYLRDALEAITSGTNAYVPATDAPGCVLDVEPQSAAVTTLTYHNRISRIVQRNCVECHRSGGVAPFSLESYQDVVAHAPMIKQVVERGTMPPWFAKGTGKEKEHEPSPWINDRSLASADKGDLLKWLQQGRPAGDPQDAPQPRQFADGWLIGKPDAVFSFAQPVKVKATGTMPYQNVTVETNLPEDKWVQAIEVRPGDRAVVHHVLVFVSGGGGDGGGIRDDGRDESAGYWGIYVPGNSTLVYPEGMAKRLPRGAKLRFQMHYTPNGTATEDTTRIGFVYAKEPPKHEVRVVGIVNVRLSIPPGAANHEEVAVLPIPVDAHVLAFLPHMHLRGKAARYELSSAGGKSQVLLDVPAYDFNWQLLYRFADPLPVSRGDTLRFTAWYDNSAANPANPDPTKTVRWGPQTTDEMHLGYVEYIVPGQGTGAAGIPARPLANLRRDPGGPAALFTVLDRDRDGQLTWEEVWRFGEQSPRWKDSPDKLREVFRKLDANSDDKVDKTEFAKVREIVGGT